MSNSFRVDLSPTCPFFFTHHYPHLSKPVSASSPLPALAWRMRFICVFRFDPRSSATPGEVFPNLEHAGHQFSWMLSWHSIIDSVFCKAQVQGQPIKMLDMPNLHATDSSEFISCVHTRPLIGFKSGNRLPSPLKRQFWHISRHRRGRLYSQ